MDVVGGLRVKGKCDGEYRTPLAKSVIKALWNSPMLVFSEPLGFACVLQRLLMYNLGFPIISGLGDFP